MRTCGSCTLCCKVMEIKELEKPMNKWCDFCDRGVGCKIYPTRPSECRTFDCLWLKDENFPDEFRPQRSGSCSRSSMAADACRLMSMRPFPPHGAKKVYAHLKRWATIQAQRNGQMIVFIGTRSMRSCRIAMWTWAT